MNLLLIFLSLLAPNVSQKDNYLLTTQKEVNSKKVEVLSKYTRSTEKGKRLVLYQELLNSDIRFRKKLFTFTNLQVSGIDESDVFSKEDVASFRMGGTIDKCVQNKLKEHGFEIGTQLDFNSVVITVIVLKIDDLYIINAQLQYNRDLLDRKRSETIRATMLQQQSYDYTRNKSEIVRLAKGLCMRSVDGFIKQMRKDETNMQAYYELLTEGLISKDFGIIN